ncbi:MAG TPA: MBL fold metallo-hydrolase RNA specificity domain-containing protein, partial [Candidatus Hydrogenedentes bacterium]|nr:MBL fold metallo-hydrolase RNA specificity domain-containing protein [Candidatus Hydrogenedentota bacterium]
PETKKFLDWVEEQGMTMRDVHTSGHPSVETLQKLVSVIKPRRTIPIHTLHRNKYRNLFGPSIVTLEDGEELEL